MALENGEVRWDASLDNMVLRQTFKLFAVLLQLFRCNIERLIEAWREFLKVCKPWLVRVCYTEAQLSKAPVILEVGAKWSVFEENLLERAGIRYSNQWYLELFNEIRHHFAQVLYSVLDWQRDICRPILGCYHIPNAESFNLFTKQIDLFLKVAVLLWCTKDVMCESWGLELVQRI